MGASGPVWQEVLRTDDRLHARGVVPVDLVWLEGHFPGHPLVAGFVQLDWMLGLARDRLGVSAAPETIEALKFRRPLPPEASVEARLEARGEQLRFELTSPRGEVHASGRAQGGAPRQHDPLAQAAAAVVPHALPLRLPQTGRMRLLERVIAHDADATTAEGVIHERTPLCRKGAVPAWIALELLAQGMAAHGALAAPAPARALLLGTRRLRLATRSFVVGERLWVRAAPLRVGAGAVAFDCALGTGTAPRDAGDAHARALAQASLTAFVEPQPTGAA